MTRECVFCGAKANSREDALPVWLGKLLDPEGGDVGYHSRSGRIRRTKTLRSKVRAVCSTCNNGWMSTLEEAAKPLLLPMIRGEASRIVQVSDRTTLAAWALKTAMMLELTKEPVPGTPRIPAEHFGSLYEFKQPPPGVSIWIGALAPQDFSDHTKLVWHHSTYRRLIPAPGVPSQDSYFIVFFVRHVVFQLFGNSGIPLRAQAVSPSISISLWPDSEAEIRWPPEMRHDEQTLRWFLDS